MSFYVKPDGALFVQAGTKFPASCPECPAYIPILDGVKFIRCWNCGLQGPIDLFIEDNQWEFQPERIM